MTEPIWNQRIYYELVCHASKDRRWLDLGCGRGPQDRLLANIRQRMSEDISVGVDVDLDSLRDSKDVNLVCANVTSLPFSNGAFELVTSNMVFEHLDDPTATLCEANRVLEEDGMLIVHTASSRHYMLVAGRVLSCILPRGTYRNLVSRYTGRSGKDIFPTGYRANTPKKLSTLARKAGLKTAFAAYLETPLGLPTGMRMLEEWMRKIVPRGWRSTLLAAYTKSNSSTEVEKEYSAVLRDLKDR